MPEISIIVPVYNAERYLTKCVKSILNQTFTDFELILIDDGSSDASPLLCDEFEKYDARVKSIHQKNCGVSAARNKGIDIACGKYIMFCDSDDYVESEWCQMMRDMAVRYPDSCVVHNAWLVNGRGDKKKIANKNFQKQIEKVRYYDLYYMSLSGSVWNRIFDLSKIKRNDIRFDENCSLGEDVVFDVNYCVLCKDIIFVTIPLYNYLENLESATHKYRWNLLELILPTFYCRVELMDRHEIGRFCDTYLYVFNNLLNNVFDKRNKMSFLKKCTSTIK